MSIKIMEGDCRSVLATLPDESVHCVVTSPPYWGLRDYGVEGQLGLEMTLAEYLATMVAVFREVRRVMRKDGTLWLNLGDSYASQGGFRDYGSHDNYVGRGPTGGQRPIPHGGLKPKDLCGMPWRVAFALQEDGWYLRQDIIWSKPNPMPESVTDRCTKAHEYIFLMTKSERYFYDAEAIAEPVTLSTWRVPGKTNGPMKAVGRASGNKTHKFVTEYDQSNSEEHRTEAGLLKISNTAYPTRNKRSVWEIATQPFSEAHFATFPPALIEPCILAGCPEKCCAKCGAPWVREIEIESKPNAPSCAGKYDGIGKHRTVSGGVWNDARKRTHLGWLPSCSCNTGTVPGIVVDPFGGAGTTGLVADRLQRNAILIELNPAYAQMARRRIVDDAPLFVNMEAAE